MNDVLVAIGICALCLAGLVIIGSVVLILGRM